MFHRWDMDWTYIHPFLKKAGYRVCPSLFCAEHEHEMGSYADLYPFMENLYLY